MTILMPDSVIVAYLPYGYPAYLGYVDGQWPTAPAVRHRNPEAHILTLTVLGGAAVADGCDIEPEDLTVQSGAAWLHGRLQAGAWRPVAYASVSRMPAVLAALAVLGVTRDRVRLLTAHYTDVPHICGPASCGELSTDADGTQYTDQAAGLHSSKIDMSLLRDDFFAIPQTVNWQENIMRQLPVLRQGATGNDVETVQALANVRAHLSIAVDGIFGIKTMGAVEAVQVDAHITQDGIVGPQTWAALLGVR